MTRAPNRPSKLPIYHPVARKRQSIAPLVIAGIFGFLAIAAALANAFHDHRRDSAEFAKSTVTAFKRWGNIDNVHLFLDTARSDDALTPDVLEFVQRFPTDVEIEHLTGLLNSKYADACERILGGIGARCAPFLVWGDESILPLGHEIYTGKFSFNRDKAIHFMVKCPDHSSVDVLVDALLETWSSESERIGKALLALERAGLDVDFRRQVHEPIVRRYHNFAMFNLPAMRTLLDATHFDPNLLVDQCLRDIRLEAKSGQAFETLSKMELIDDRRFEVAEAIQEVIKAGGISGFQTDECFLHWATPKNSHVYDILNGDGFGGDKWKAALRIALTDSTATNKVIVPGTCRVLQVIGSEKSIDPLKKLLAVAKKVRNQDVYNAVLLAGRVITERVGPTAPAKKEK